MTLREAAQQALEALELLDRVMRRSQLTDAAITALRAALAEPQRKPLTEEELAEMWVGIFEVTHPSGVHEDGLVPFRFARAIEAAHGIGDSDGS